VGDVGKVANVDNVKISVGVRADAKRFAELHVARITEGFLPVLGTDFLGRLYRRVVASDDAFAFVAHSEGPAVGFCAVALDVGALYKRFMTHDGLLAGALAAPQIVRNARRVFETLRYTTHDGGELPKPEILSVAVDASVAGRGVGRALVERSQAEMVRRGVPAAKVVAGSDNAAALGLYRACGFEEAARIQVHAGIQSSILVWQAPDREGRRKASNSDALRRPARAGDTAAAAAGEGGE
jgi:ribosomal protein S18 acetylase RimI-like enzyme